MTYPNQPYQGQPGQEQGQAPQPAQPASSTSENVTPDTPGTGATPTETAAQQEVNLQATPGEDDRPADGTVFYCPACGKRVAYRQQCSGSPVAPHQPTEVVDAAELWDSHSTDAQGNVTHDPEQLTAAPDSPGDI